MHCSSCARRHGNDLGLCEHLRVAMRTMVCGTGCSSLAAWSPVARKALPHASGKPCSGTRSNLLSLPGPVSHLCYQQRWLGSTPRRVGLRATRRPIVERCANRLQRLELAPCPCIALVLTARVPSTVAGSSLVMTFEYGEHPRCVRWARDERRSACAPHGVRWSLSASRTRDRSRSPRRQGPLAGRVRDPDGLVGHVWVMGNHW